MLAFAYSKRMGERHALQERLFVENTAVHQTHYVRQGSQGGALQRVLYYCLW